MRKAMIVAAVLSAWLCGSAVAQVKYVDEQGQTHYVQNENLIPEKYRSKATGVGPLPQIQADDGSARRSVDGVLSQGMAPSPTGRAGVPSMSAPSQSQDSAEFERVSGMCQAYVNKQSRGRNRVEGAKEFKTSASGDQALMYGTDSAKFAWADCMRQSGHPVTK